MLIFFDLIINLIISPYLSSKKSFIQDLTASYEFSKKFISVERHGNVHLCDILSKSILRVANGDFSRLLTILVNDDYAVFSTYPMNIRK